MTHILQKAVVMGRSTTMQNVTYYKILLCNKHVSILYNFHNICNLHFIIMIFTDIVFCMSFYPTA